MQRHISKSSLLIIMALTAVVILVAIPHLSSRRPTEENIIVNALKAYADAQDAFRTQGMGTTMGTHNNEQGNAYCPSFSMMGGFQAARVEGKELTLLSGDIANAKPDAPYAGYYFTDDPNISNWNKQFGLYARPANYGTPFTTMYYISTNRVIWKKDPGAANKLLPLDNTWVKVEDPSSTTPAK